MPEPMRRNVTLRRVRMIGATLLVTLAFVGAGFQGLRAVTLDEAARDQIAGEPDAAQPKVQDLRDPNIRDLRPGVPPPQVPYLIDLTTRDMTPLPEAITRSASAR
jgi:hypothetical protein